MTYGMRQVKFRHIYWYCLWALSSELLSAVPSSIILDFVRGWKKSQVKSVKFEFQNFAQPSHFVKSSPDASRSLFDAHFLIGCPFKKSVFPSPFHEKHRLCTSITLCPVFCATQLFRQSHVCTNWEQSKLQLWKWYRSCCVFRFCKETYIKIDK